MCCPISPSGTRLTKGTVEKEGLGLPFEDGEYFFVRCFDLLDPNLRAVDHLWYCCTRKCRRASPRRDYPRCSCAPCRYHWSDQHRRRCTSVCRGAIVGDGIGYMVGVDLVCPLFADTAGTSASMKIDC